MADWNDFKNQELRQSEIQLARSIEKNALLVTKLEEAQDEIERAHDQIASQLRVIEGLKERNRKLEGFKDSQESERDSYSRGYFDEKDKKTDELYAALKNKDRVIETLTSNQIFSQEKLEELRSTLAEKQLEIDTLQKRLKHTEKSVDALFLNQKTEGEFVSELQHLRLDNQRLLSLLSKSQEFKVLGDFTELTDGAHYIPNSKATTDETYNWVPQRVVKAIEIYKKSPNLSEEVLNTLLLEINKSFRDREKAQTSKLKHEFQTKIDDLKRQLLMRQPYDNVRTKRQNSRLKSELKKANDEVSFRSAKQLNSLPRMQDLEDTFRILNALKVENSKLNKENSELKKTRAVKSQFLQGVGWLGEKVMKEKAEMHKMISKLVGGFEFDGSMSKERQDWLMENIENIVEDFSQNVEGLVDSQFRES